jgi:hypothetical protein
MEPGVVVTPLSDLLSVRSRAALTGVVSAPILLAELGSTPLAASS